MQESGSAEPASVGRLRWDARLAIGGLVLVIVGCVGRLATYYGSDDGPHSLLVRGTRLVLGLGVTVTITFFIAWLHTATSNLVGWGLRPRWTGERVMWCWIIPGVNLVWPLRVMRDVARRSGSGPGGMVLLVAWWVAFLGELGASYVFLHGPPVAAHMAICAAVLAIAVVVYMTQLQVRRQAELDAAGA